MVCQYKIYKNCVVIYNNSIEKWFCARIEYCFVRIQRKSNQTIMFNLHEGES
jgi:hypothetical protein